MSFAIFSTSNGILTQSSTADVKRPALAQRRKNRPRRQMITIAGARPGPGRAPNTYDLTC
jgi:hypothetical protein